ncbi:MFS transporter [Sphaerotilus sp.]|uniref:MFS transporter n=1 Tax=Sphaerotilus sp. TaxID=2093942 RepID=UPI0034E1FBB3
MTEPSPRVVLTGVFFAFALGLGLFAGAIPTLMHQTGLDTAGLGLALTLHSAAYVGAMTAGGWLLRRVEVRGLMRAVLVLHALTFVALFAAGSPVALTASLFALGLTAGTIDLAMNTDGTALEREAGRPVLIRMHAAASGAFALGAIGGSVLASQFGALACAGLAVLSIAPVVWALTRIPPRGPVSVAPSSSGAGHAAVAPSRAHLGLPVLLLGVVLGVCIAAEITAQMWSAQFLAQQARPNPALAGAGAALFAGCQAIVRSLGDTLRRRFDDHRVITVSLVLAALGFTAVALADGFTGSVLGFALVGVGTACVVPCCFALVARQAPQRSADALGVASLVAGALRLPTPLCLGFVAAAWSDAVAFGGIAGLLVAGAVLVVWMNRRPAPAVAAFSAPGPSR